MVPSSEPAVDRRNNAECNDRIESGAESTRVSQLKDSLEVAWKFAIAFSTATFLMGFVVVTTYVRGFGFNAGIVPAAKYFGAGCWALVPIVAGWLMITIVLAIAKKSALDRGFRLQSAVGAVLVVFLLLAVLLLVISDRLLGWAETWPFLVRFSVTVVAGGSMTLPVLFLRPGDETELRERLSGVEYAVFNALLILCSILLAISYLAIFARLTYADIPAELAGGKPQMVEIIASDEIARHKMMAAGIPFRTEKAVESMPIKLILATEKEYIVATNTDKRTVTIANDLVHLVVFQPDR